MAMLKGGKFLLQNTIQDISKPDMFSSKHTVELQARVSRGSGIRVLNFF